MRKEERERLEKIRERATERGLVLLQVSRRVNYVWRKVGDDNYVLVDLARGILVCGLPLDSDTGATYSNLEAIEEHLHLRTVSAATQWSRRRRREMYEPPVDFFRRPV